MVGKLFIDGRDAFLEYGVFVEKGGYKQLIQLPAFKKLDETEWGEYDGTEVDLSAPVLDTRSLQIQFCIVNKRYAEDLFDDLSTGAYHVFEFKEIQKTYKLRMTSNGSFSTFIKLGKLSLSFNDDFPEIPEGSPYRIYQTEVRQVGFEIDGVDFSQFGSYILRGTEDSIQKAANVRDNLKSSNASTAGIKYDGDFVFFKNKDVTLKLLIDATDITEFWKRWNALFSIMLQPDSRSFYYSELGSEYECYYKNMSVSKFDILKTGKVWCEFSINLTFTSYRPVGQYLLLATEDFDFVITEEEVNPARIRIRPKRGISLFVTEDGAYVITEPDSDKIYFNN